MELTGKYGKAIVYTEEIENEAISQIINLLNQQMTEGANVRIMPDVHSGKGCVIGYTAKTTGKIVPNLIGVDINCGVTAWKLGKRSVVKEKFEKLDKVIRNNIPSGRKINESIDFRELEIIYKALNIRDKSFGDFHQKILDICTTTNQDFNYVLRSIGSLGGGNHFIEIDRDNEDYLWLLIHSGSRNFGLKIANYHQEVAEKTILGIDDAIYQTKIEEIKRTKKGKGIEAAIKKLKSEAKKGKATGLEYLEGDKAEDYYHDMEVVQIYAQLSRRIMGTRILQKMYKMDYFDPVESIHNYINFEDNIVRKGAISAHKDEEVLIPLNMADGCIYGKGLGNKDWNFSAPHGAGRKMSRSKAKKSIRLDDYQEIMKNKKIWTSSVGKRTLDEAPQAYKKAAHIISYLEPTVEVISHMKPVYNFKASE